MVQYVPFPHYKKNKVIHDTIIARASAPGSAIRGMIRVSGQCAAAAVETIVDQSPLASLTSREISGRGKELCHCIPTASRTFKPDNERADARGRSRKMTRSGSIDTQIVLPQFPPFPATLLFWREGYSYTGDDTIEIHTIGSSVLLDAIMAALIAASDSIRLAMPGEFTLRAFLSGRLDLAQAEAVLGVIDAANDTDLKTALHQLAGNVSAPLSALRTLLFDTLARLEASLDFAEEDITIISEQELQQTLAEAWDQTEQLRQRIAHRGIDGDKPCIVLTGRPNAGKSTFFNRLLQREAALVSPLAGTTRDYLEAEIDWDGIPAILIDTAGIDAEAASELDEAAQTKAHELLKRADVVVYCFEAGDETADSRRQTAADFAGTPTVLFQTKTPNDSLEPLVKEVGSLLRRSPTYGMLPNTALRCREALIAASDSLARARELTDSSLLALELRNAVNQLGLIDGTVHTEDILQNIFSRFCIGK